MLATMKATLMLCVAAVLVAGCAPNGPPRPAASQSPEKPLAVEARDLALLNRVTWGANTLAARELAREGTRKFLDGQLNPSADDGIPAIVREQVPAAFTDAERPEDIAKQLQSERQAPNSAPDANPAAASPYRDTLNMLAHRAAARSLLRDLYSRNQLKEQMTWFWFNHFNVDEHKADIRAWIGDYEDRAIRPHALGHFRDLLAATVRHPAMLIYLDNAQNARGHINENYAREIMELHTLGINGGYSQKDVQELARILTGLGVNKTGAAPDLPPALRSQYVRDGLFEFNPRRHDYGDKIFLGHIIKGAGLSEVDLAIDLLSRSPSTARFVCRKIAVYFVSDNPPDPLVARMTATFEKSDGDIAAVLRTMFASPEFTASLGTKFKDPMHFIVSAIRASYGNETAINTQLVETWLNLLGEPLYGHETPDGYPLAEAPWLGSGDMAARFKVARAIGSGRAALIATADDANSKPVPPQISLTPYYRAISASLGAGTRAALAQAKSPANFNMLFLSSPEFMRR